MFTLHLRRQFAIVACVATAITLLCWACSSKPRHNQKEVAAAEDEVYEAVVRDMITPIHGEVHLSQLVFDDTVLTGLLPGADVKSCKETARKRLWLESSKPLYDSFADKVYRVFTLRAYDGSLRPDTTQDFLKMACTAGRLSQTFHTDLPRTFIAAESVHFKDWPIEENGMKSFEQLFPGAGGIISFSHVGFDSTLHEAIVSTAFVCAGLCGSGYRYILRKERGRWEVVNKLMLWVS